MQVIKTLLSPHSTTGTYSIIFDGKSYGWNCDFKKINTLYTCRFKNSQDALDDLKSSISHYYGIRRQQLNELMI